MANIIVLSLSPSGIQNRYDKIDLYVEIIPFFVFRFLVKVTKKGKNQLSFSGKMQIFYTENKQTGQLIFFWFLVTLTKKRKTKNGMNSTLTFWRGTKI